MTPENIPYIAHEGEVTRLCGIIHKLTAIIILLILLLVGSNIGWMIYESSFEDVTTTTTQEVTQDAENGVNNFAGGDLIGEADGKDNNDQNDTEA